MMVKPLVSVIVPVYNGAKYLRESLDSILGQTYQPTEILVMDDASTDATPGILASYGNRITSYRQPRNRGIYGNMNDGIARARGEFIAIYHADDVYYPTIVEREAAFLQQYPQAGAVFCLDIFMNTQGREYGRLVLPPEVRGSRPLEYRVIFNAILKYKNFLPCPSSIVRASAYRAVGPYRDEEFRNNADLEMWLRLARRYPIGIVEEYLFRYRRGHGGSAERHRHLRTDQERHFRIMDLYLGDGDRALATPEALAAHEAHRAQDSLMRAISLYILGKLEQAGSLLHEVTLRQLLGSRQVQRGRLFILLLALRALVRLPRVGFIANAFYRRWHGKGRAEITGGAGRPDQSDDQVVTPSRVPTYEGLNA
jgi:glycosyltransferase involved in cell wall biosynthesis